MFRHWLEDDAVDHLAEIVLEIRQHHVDNPSHGRACACMDKYVQRLRRLTEVPGAEAQLRVDYVLRAATENRVLKPEVPRG